MLEDYANNPWIVLIAYTGVFFPWTAVTATDFLSSTWKPVAHARHDGQLQTLFVTVPTLYIMFYIYLQFLAEDFKQAFTAIVGLIFSLIHLLRTLWGLWQLHEFHRWASRAIAALRFVDIKYQLSDSDDNVSPDILADRILINDSVVDNQLLHGDVRCYLRYGSFDLRSSSSLGPNRLSESMLARIKVLLLFVMIPVHWLLSRLIDTFARLCNLRFQSAKKLRQVPTEPVELWLNWATAFVSQGLGAWVDEIDDVIDHPDRLLGDHEDDVMKAYRARRAYFAKEVLASAVLQMGRTDTGKGFATNPLLWDSWSDSTGMADGWVTKQELFCKAITNGDGLPFETPHNELFLNSQRSVGAHSLLTGKSVGYGPYSSKLQRVVESMPAAFGEEIKRFNVAKLEWFTIMLYVGIADIRSKESSRVDMGSSGKESNSDSQCDPDDERVEVMGNVDFALDNLGLQLGFSRDESGNMLAVSDERLRVFPFHRKAVAVVSATNRLVPKVGEFIDLWLALVSGEQISFLLSIDETWEALCLGNEGDVLADDLTPTNGETVVKTRQRFTDGEEEGSRSNPQLRANQQAVSTAALEHSYANERQQYAYMEQTLTFMGYDMEYVRTELAQWLSQNESQQIGTLSPGVPYRPSDNLKCEPMHAGSLSKELSRAIRDAGHPSYLRQRAMHVRLLWELRGLLQKKLEGNNEVPSCTRAMVLCLLAFPSLSIDIKETNGVEESSSHCNQHHIVQVEELDSEGSNISSADCSFGRTTVRRWILSVRPRCPPQQLYVEVELLSKRDSRLSVKTSICRSCGTRDGQFRWEWWRDSFISRLESVEKWQHLHHMNSPAVSDCTGNITEGFRVMPVYLRGTGLALKTWAGWTPFRTTICRAELLSKGFLTEPGQKRKIRIEFDSPFLATHARNGHAAHLSTAIDTQDRIAISYEEARRDSLRHACLVVGEVLGSGNSGFDDEALNRGERDGQTNVVLKQAQEQLSKGPHLADRAALLFEVAAVELGSTEGLKQIIELLTDGVHIKPDVIRAVEVIERYLSVYLGKPVWDRRLSVGKRLGDRVENIHRLYQRLIHEYGYNYRVVCSYGRWVSMAMGDKYNLDSEYLRARIREALIYTRKPAYLMSLAIYTTGADISDVSSFINNGQQDMSPFPDFASEQKEICSKKPTPHPFLTESRNRLRYSLLELSIKKGRDVVVESNIGMPGQSDKAAQADYEKGSRLDDSSQIDRSYSTVLFNLGRMLRYGVDGVKQDSVRAMNLFEQAAENEDVEGTVAVANMLLTGEGTDKDPARAVHMYEKAISYGDIIATYNLARALMDGEHGVPEDKQRAFALYEKAVDQGGYIRAMVNLAIKLFHGDDGIKRNPRRAAALYERAIAESADLGAMFNLANSLKSGAPGVPIDVKRAVSLYERAIDVGNHTESMYNLANLLIHGATGISPDCKRAVNLYERVIAQNGPQEARVSLAILLSRGTEGVPQDINKALKLLQSAIDERGDPNAIFNLGVIMENGAEGFQSNVSMAMKLYERAIKEGNHIKAMVAVAQALHHGKNGYPKDLRRAVQLYEKAVEEGGDALAMYNLALLLETGAEGVTRNVQKSLELYNRNISEAQDVDSMIRLAMLLSRSGSATEMNTARAVELYERAIESANSVSAMINLGNILCNGATNVNRDPRRAAELYRKAIEADGDPTAMLNLSNLLLNGCDDIETDVEGGVELLEMAIEKGNIEAMNNLATRLQLGLPDGIPQDLRRAASLYEKAALDGKHVGSMRSLGFMLWKGFGGIEKDMKKALQFFEMAVKEGDATACMSFGLALCEVALSEGTEGGAKDFARAAQLFQMAIDKGDNTAAMHFLAYLLEGPPGVTRNVKRAVELYRRAVHDGNKVESMKALMRLFTTCDEAEPDPGEVSRLRAQLEDLQEPC